MFFPLVTLLSENMKGSVTYKSILSDVMAGSGIFWLSFIVSLGFTVLPLYAMKGYEMTIKAPQFYKE